MAAHITIPKDWDDNGLALLEKVRGLIRAPELSIREWRCRGVGRRGTRSQDIGRLYITGAGARRFIASTVPQLDLCSDG